MQVGRPGKHLTEQRAALARVATHLEGSKSSDAAGRAYKNSGMRLLWLDAGAQPALQLLFPGLFFIPRIFFDVFLFFFPWSYSNLRCSYQMQGRSVPARSIGTHAPTSSLQLCTPY